MSGTDPITAPGEILPLCVAMQYSEIRRDAFRVSQRRGEAARNQTLGAATEERGQLGQCILRMILHAPE